MGEEKAMSDRNSFMTGVVDDSKEAELSALTERHASVMCSIAQSRGDRELNLCLLVKTSNAGRGVWRVIAERLDGTMIQ
jgi:hypothetical protein